MKNKRLSFLNFCWHRGVLVIVFFCIGLFAGIVSAEWKYNKHIATYENRTNVAITTTKTKEQARFHLEFEDSVQEGSNGLTKVLLIDTSNGKEYLLMYERPDGVVLELIKDE